MSTEKNVLIGFAAAALAGVTIGLLVAPDSGKNTREKLRQGSNKLLDVVRSNRETIKEKATDIIDDAKSAFNQAKGYAKSEINHAKSEMNHEAKHKSETV